MYEHISMELWGKFSHSRISYRLEIGVDPKLGILPQVKSFITRILKFMETIESLCPDFRGELAMSKKL